MKRKIITPNLTGVKKIVLSSLLIITLCFLNIILCSNHNSSALTYSSNVDVGFTFNPTISVNLSGDLLINNLAPGSTSDSNTISVTVATNASQGYALTATAGTNTTNTDLVNQSNSAYKFSSIATNADLANLTTDNTWGFSYSSDNGSNWSNYSGLPLDNDDEGATGKQLLSTINPADNQTIQFKIGAKAASDQAAGTYQNTVNFYAVANPDPTLQPVSCPAGKICYNPNSLTTVVGEMGQQTPSSSQLTDGVQLWASNFSREGYGFAGWSDAVNGNGAKYGPNETITAPDDISTNGYSLYAIWVKSASDLQNWTGCSNLSQGEVTALKDTRDNNVYAVAKLADGKCWMIENLRLDNTPELTSANTHNPSLPLNNSWYYRDSQTTLTTSNYLSATTDPTTTAWCQTNSSNCDNQSMLATNNTTLFINNTSSNNNYSSDIYGYGNYYNWYSATAGHGKYGDDYGNGYNAPGDVCPAGWHLPIGKATTGEFALLDIALGGTGAYSDSHTTPTGATISSAYRSYPNNFVYSGTISGARIINRDYVGYYWTSSGYRSGNAFALSISTGSVFPGSYDGYDGDKHIGWPIRCIAGT